MASLFGYETWWLGGWVAAATQIEWNQSWEFPRNSRNEKENNGVRERKSRSSICIFENRKPRFIILTYVSHMVRKGYVERAHVPFWTRLRNHATFGNDIWAISYTYPYVKQLRRGRWIRISKTNCYSPSVGCQANESTTTCNEQFRVQTIEISASGLYHVMEKLLFTFPSSSHSRCLAVRKFTWIC